MSESLFDRSSHLSVDNFGAGCEVVVVELVDDVEVLAGSVLVVSEVIVVGGALVVVELVVLVGEDVEVVVAVVLAEADCVVVGPASESFAAGANPRSAANMAGSFPSMPSAQIPSPARSLEEATCATS